MDIPELVENDEAENKVLTGYPFTLKLDIGTTNQNVLSYHISVLADRTFRTTDDNDDVMYMVRAGEEIYVNDVDVDDNTENIDVYKRQGLY